MRPHAVLVDPYSGAADLGPAFRARGVPTVAVLSTPGPFPFFAWRPEVFDVVHCWRGGTAELVDRLAPYQPLCVVPGNESGVELVEELAAAFVPGAANAPALRAARRDKWEMARAVAARGIPHLRQIWASDPDEVADWQARNGLAGARLVLKPPKSGGTDGTHVTGPGEDWRPCFDAINGVVNRYGERNQGVLVQEYADGEEYVVDMYSAAGRHGLVEVCRYAKQSRGNRLGLYRRTDFLPPDHPCVPQVRAYAAEVADAVGVRNGSTHVEVMLTADGPRLIEIAARLAGTPLQQAARLATGDCQIDRTVRHVLDGEFSEGYEFRQHVSILVLSAPHAGILRNGESLDALRDLPTARLASFPRRSGEWVPQTVDLFTLLGWVVLASPDAEALERDCALVRQAERSVLLDAGGGVADAGGRGGEPALP